MKGKRKRLKRDRYLCGSNYLSKILIEFSIEIQLELKLTNLQIQTRNKMLESYPHTQIRIDSKKTINMQLMI